MTRLPLLINVSCTLFFTIYCTSLFGQSSVPTATLQKQDGSTEKGYIHTPEHLLTTQSILFSKSLNGDKISYSAIDLKGFTVGDRVFEGQVMEVDASKIARNTLKITDTVTYRLDTFFMEEVARGSISLYEYIDENLKNHYILKDNEGKYSELNFQRKLVQVENRQTGNITYTVQEREGYKSTLKLLMADCPTVERKIDKAAYYRGKLASIFEAYYICKEERNTIVRKAKGGGLKLDLLGGLHSSKTSYGTPFGRVQFARENQPIFGLGTELSLGGRLEKVAFLGEFFYKPSSYEAINTKLRFDLLKAQLGGRIYTSRKAVSPFVDIGFGVGLRTRYKYEIGNASGSQVFIDNSSIAVGESSGFIGAGTTIFKRFSLSGRFEFGVPYIDRVSTSTRTTAFYAMLRYRLYDSSTK